MRCAVPVGCCHRAVNHGLFVGTHALWMSTAGPYGIQVPYKVHHNTAYVHSMFLPCLHAVNNDNNRAPREARGLTSLPRVPRGTSLVWHQSMCQGMCCTYCTWAQAHVSVCMICKQRETCCILFTGAGAGFLQWGVMAYPCHIAGIHLPYHRHSLGISTMCMLCHSELSNKAVMLHKAPIT